MVAVAVTYAAAIGLVLFVDRRKVMPVLTEQLASLGSVVSNFRKGKPTKDSKAARERGVRRARRVHDGSPLENLICDGDGKWMRGRVLSRRSR